MASARFATKTDHIRIGDTIDIDHNREPIVVKNLNELCNLTPGVHLHVTTSADVRCLPLN